PHSAPALQVLRAGPRVRPRRLDGDGDRQGAKEPPRPALRVPVPRASVIEEAGARPHARRAGPGKRPSGALDRRWVPHAPLLRSAAGGPGADGSHSRHRADLGARRPHVAPRRKADERRGTLFRAQYTLISPGGGPAFVENGNRLAAVRDAFPELV